MTFLNSKKSSFKIAMVVAASLPLMACIDSDDSDELSANGELDITSLAANVDLLNIGLDAGEEAQDIFADALEESVAASQGTAAGTPADVNCEASGTQSASLTEQGSFSVVYSECTDLGSEVINGSISGNIATGIFTEYTSGIYALDYDVQYQSLVLTDNSVQPAKVETLDGDLSVSAVFALDTWNYEVNSTNFSYTKGDVSFALEDAHFNMSGASEQGDPIDKVNWTYDFYITGTAGSFYVQSIGEIGFDATNVEERVGSLQIEGGNAVLTVEFVSDGLGGSANLSLDVDKDGTVDVEESLTQSEFDAL